MARASGRGAKPKVGRLEGFQLFTDMVSRYGKTTAFTGFFFLVFTYFMTPSQRKEFIDNYFLLHIVQSENCNKYFFAGDFPL
jgi:hypothetical protein